MAVRPVSNRTAAARQRLAQLAGDRKTLDVAAHADELRLVVVSGTDENTDHRPFNASPDRVTLTADQPVAVIQGRIRVAGIDGYLDQIERGDQLAEIMVTDRFGTDPYRHLDGLHRLIAARLADAPVAARIWR